MQQMNTILNQPVNYDEYIMDDTNPSVRMGGRFNQSVILTYKDESEWIFLNNKGEERFLGYLYLQDAIKQAGLNQVAAAPNKMAIHDREIIYLSQYKGEKRLDFFEHTEELTSLKEVIGFVDTAGNANLRKQDDKIFVFDTEKSSFHPKVHEKINSFVHLHKDIFDEATSRIKE